MQFTEVVTIMVMQNVRYVEKYNEVCFMHINPAWSHDVL